VQNNFGAINPIRKTETELSHPDQVEQTIERWMEE